MSASTASSSVSSGRWTGAELVAQPQRWGFELTDAHAAELLEATAATAGSALVEIDADRFRLPTLGPLLTVQLAELLAGRGFTLLRGLPIDGLDEPTIERMFWGLGVHLGDPLSQNAAGDLLVHVRDGGLDFSDPTVRAYETAARLDYHSDSSDLVGLLCIRPAPEGGVSTIVSSAAVYHEALARRPDLRPELDASWWWDRRQADLSTSFFQRRIFAVGPTGDLVSYYGRAHIESACRGPQVPALDPRRTELLDLLDELANDPAMVLDMHFRPGDVQFLNNYRVWHARTAYVDDPDPALRRDLCRLWLTVRHPLELPEDFQRGGITERTENRR